MTNCEEVWGEAEKRWQEINYRSSELLTVLTVFAWVGMVLFFVFAAFSLLTRTDGATIGVLASIGLWLATAIAAIRIRRGRRKFLRAQF
jgi:uncharacterized membrane protein (DUF485 family)